MTFEFLIACRMTSDADLYLMLREMLSEALLNSQDEFDEEAVGQMIRIRHQRSGDEFVDNDGETARHTVLGFTVELPATDSSEAIVDDFANSLSGSGSIVHSLRFEDPLLQDELAHRAAEIFALEMKLRRVLSFIYLHAYQREDPYDLLREEQVEPVTPSLRKNDMVSVTENQFFHITFRQYINLNQRRDLRQLSQLLDVIRDAENYDVFRGEITRRPIADERDTELLNDLKSLMNPIEQMRNCVAHNRRPTGDIRQNYVNTLPFLEQRLDKFLDDLARPRGQAGGQDDSS